jgi:antitoxin (DNA-binding transcriptional repressor) of toxin-antitoxin stability system
MRSATIEEALECLPELLAAARAGETVEITEPGQSPVSLVLTNSGTAPAAEAPDAVLIARLQAAGLLDPSRSYGVPDLSILDGLPDGDSGVLQALLDERDESW